MGRLADRLRRLEQDLTERLDAVDARLAVLEEARQTPGGATPATPPVKKAAASKSKSE